MTGGDYLFDPQSGSKYSKDDDHIAQIMELVGDFPRSIAFSGKYSSEFFNRKGELRHIHRLRFWPVESVLHDKYLLPRDDADLIGSFLTPMLRLDPEKRAAAGELIHHVWLDGIQTQGEIDAIRRAEVAEREPKAGASSSSEAIVALDKGKGKSNATNGEGLTADDEDALKPVVEDSDYTSPPPAPTPNSAPSSSQHPPPPRRKSTSKSGSKSKSTSKSKTKTSKFIP